MQPELKIIVSTKDMVVVLLAAVLATTLKPIRNPMIARLERISVLCAFKEERPQS